MRHARGIAAADPRHYLAALLVGASLSVAGTAAAIPAPAQLVAVQRSGTIEGSVSASLRRAAVPGPVAHQFLTALAEVPDMPHALAQGSSFAVVYAGAGRSNPPSAPAAPRLRFASIVVGGKEHRVYRYAMNQGTVAYVDGSGRGSLPVHLSMPVPGAPVTSPWGWRIHPVLGVRLFHKGIDYGAPEGTPVHATGDGVVEDIGWRGNYGRYIRVRHSNHLETAYAHLSAFAAGLQPGSHVRRGQSIASVGETGLATGPHLYYEILVDGRRVNPARGSLDIPVRIDGRELHRLRSEASRLMADAEIRDAAPCPNYVEPACLPPQLAAGTGATDFLPPMLSVAGITL